MLLGSALLYHTPFGSPLICDLDPDMVPEGIQYRTNWSFTNISSSRGSTIMFDISKSFAQLFLAVNGDKLYFPFLFILKYF